MSDHNPPQENPNIQDPATTLGVEELLTERNQNQIQMAEMREMINQLVELNRAQRQEPIPPEAPMPPPMNDPLPPPRMPNPFPPPPNMPPPPPLYPPMYPPPPTNPYQLPIYPPPPHYPSEHQDDIWSQPEVGPELNPWTSEIEKMKEYMRKNMGEKIVDVDGICSKPLAKLPERFKFPDIDKFDGTTDPRIHLKLYVSALRHAGLTEQHLVEQFYRYLTGPALRWFMSLDPSRTRTFEDIATVFTQQYDYNSLLDVTLRELELTKQETGESFSTFLTRWRAKAAQMVNRPSEREQVLLIKKNLQPQFRKSLGPIPISTFRDLLDAGTYVEDELQATAGAKAKGTSSGKGKKANVEKTGVVNATFQPS